MYIQYSFTAAFRIVTIRLSWMKKVTVLFVILVTLLGDKTKIWNVVSTIYGPEIKIDTNQLNRCMRKKFSSISELYFIIISGHSLRDIIDRNCSSLEDAFLIGAEADNRTYRIRPNYR